MKLNSHLYFRAFAQGLFPALLLLVHSLAFANGPGVSIPDVSESDITEADSSDSVAVSPVTSMIVSPKNAETPCENSSVEARFRTKIAHINKTLVEKQSNFLASTSELAQFVDSALLPIWSSERTLKGLLGKSNWNNLEPLQKTRLQQGFNNTIQRYVQESFDKYDGQKLEYVSIKLNEAGTRGILTVKVVPNLLPSFELNFRFLKNEQEWLLYDALARGVSYVSLKKDSFRSAIKKAGVEQLIQEINRKNSGYLESKYLQSRHLKSKYLKSSYLKSSYLKSNYLSVSSLKVRQPDNTKSDTKVQAD